jgi:hypothetical protein
VLECGIYAVATGIEVCAGYSADDVVRTQLTPEIGGARDVAAEWRQALSRRAASRNCRRRESASTYNRYLRAVTDST